MGKLVAAVKSTVAKRGFLTGLDGRKLPIRSDHAALNTLLQSAGAVLMKQALVFLDQDLRKEFTAGEDFEFMLNIHDEWQLECRPEIADQVGGMCVRALEKAGEFFEFKCPITGQYQVGNSWADTH